MPLLPSLPNELLEEVVRYVERLKDRKSLRRTCSRLALFLRPHVLQEVTLNIYKGNIEPGIDLLKVLATPKNIYSPLIRTLYIDSLSPSHHPSCKRDALYGERDPDDCKHFGVRKKGAEEQMLALLKPALGSLELCWVYKDSREALTTIMQSFSESTLQRVEEFTFYYDPLPYTTSPFFEMIPPLPAFSNLSVLVIRPPLVRQWQDFHGVLLLHLLSRQKSLSAVHLDTCLHDDALTNNALEELASHSHITHLSLGSWVKGPTEILSEFPHLRSLEMHCPEERGLLFLGLTAKGIYLRSLTWFNPVYGRHVLDHLLDYIEGYSGLEVLSLRGYILESFANDNIDRFYRRILPLHCDTLSHLAIEPEIGFPWCNGPFELDNLDAIGRCQNLRYLSLRCKSVLLNQSSGSGSKGAQSSSSAAHDGLFKAAGITGPPHRFSMHSPLLRA
ncbi:hypothetical protein D9758_007021 [Tetrapyrgos nigripes]|uniref:F-box domain-containing protein n=1 Tax=Tetrapyrgos nigripes TaxID=182062 RepID=A0A8H5GDF4_9AGAR|nr:hypothetical protein D9758_007021 [Tetrapyrgos nigripes]